MTAQPCQQELLAVHQRYVDWRLYFLYFLSHLRWAAVLSTGPHARMNTLSCWLLGSWLSKCWHFSRPGVETDRVHPPTASTMQSRVCLSAADSLTRLALCCVAGCFGCQVRAMQIIDELEVNKRGPYGGGIGVVGFSGRGKAHTLTAWGAPGSSQQRTPSRRAQLACHSACSVRGCTITATSCQPGKCSSNCA